jgi:hypothetical protein
MVSAPLLPQPNPVQYRVGMVHYHDVASTLTMQALPSNCCALLMPHGPEMGAAPVVMGGAVAGGRPRCDPPKQALPRAFLRCPSPDGTQTAISLVTAVEGRVYCRNQKASLSWPPWDNSTTLMRRAP